MATLEDKILGNKIHNYCSSSEGEDSSESDDDSNEKPPKVEESPSAPPEINAWEGSSTNTGPKGVIKDWQRFKQIENEKRAEDEREKLALMKKLTLAVKSTLDEEKEKAALEDPDLAELLNDEMLLNYQKQRMQEMLQQVNHNIKFGNLIQLSTREEFLDAIDGEHKSVTVVVHIYEKNIEACGIMNACLRRLCRDYTNVKFCTIMGSKVGMSKHFKIDGVPALLIYKDGNLIGNFVRLSDELGDNFDKEDVQEYLIEHGILEDKSCTPSIVKSSADNDDDSD